VEVGGGVVWRGNLFGELAVPLKLVLQLLLVLAIVRKRVAQGQVQRLDRPLCLMEILQSNCVHVTTVSSVTRSLLSYQLKEPLDLLRLHAKRVQLGDVDPLFF